MQNFAKGISTHALREEGDLLDATTLTVSIDFYPRPPRGGRPARLTGRAASKYNFYPRPPRGGRRDTGPPGPRTSVFLPTPSARRATQALLLRLPRLSHFYPRPPRGGRLMDFPYSEVAGTISTHALREEGDSISFVSILLIFRFLPTPSARRATLSSNNLN